MHVRNGRGDSRTSFKGGSFSIALLKGNSVGCVVLLGEPPKMVDFRLASDLKPTGYQPTNARLTLLFSYESCLFLPLGVQGNLSLLEVALCCCRGLKQTEANCLLTLGFWGFTPYFVSTAPNPRPGAGALQPIAGAHHGGTKTEAGRRHTGPSS